MTTTVFVGTDAANDGAGLHSLSHSRDDGWVCNAAFPGAANASFAAYSSRHDLYYLVDERRDGRLGTFRRKGDTWHKLADVATAGAAPCYVALNGAEDRVAVANYGSGSIVIFLLDENTGLPMADPAVRQNVGTGAVADRQDGPHAHCVCFDLADSWLYHVDLGTDQIIAYAVDAGTGAIGDRRIAFTAPPGSGPRHLCFHPTLPLAILASELASTLTVLRIDDGILSAIHHVSTLPKQFLGESIVGHLSLDSSGTRIYVTNRGHDSVAVFSWNDGGMPRLFQHVDSGGASPRAFVLLEEERMLVLANEQGGTVTMFDMLANGTLTEHRQDLSVPGAVFVFAERPTSG